MHRRSSNGLVKGTLEDIGERDKVEGYRSKREPQYHYIPSFTILTYNNMSMQ